VARKKKCKVFVSYSRHDEALVKPLASLLGAAANDAVFFDVTSLKAGDPWETEIFTAVKQASVFVLCWCCESERSSFVAREISAALSEGNKRLVPVLFCSTPLPPHLANRQWTDLRGKVIHECPTPHPKQEEKKPVDYTTIFTPRVPGGEVDEALDKKLKASPKLPPMQTQTISKSLLFSVVAIVTVLCTLLLAFMFSSVFISYIRLFYVVVYVIVGLLSIVAIFSIFNSTKGTLSHRTGHLQEADTIASQARAYFEGLGRK
jgi:hypothetical protein